MKRSTILCASFAVWAALSLATVHVVSPVGASGQLPTTARADTADTVAPEAAWQGAQGACTQAKMNVAALLRARSRCEVLGKQERSAEAKTCGATVTNLTLRAGLSKPNTPAAFCPAPAGEPPGLKIACISGAFPDGGFWAICCGDGGVCAGATAGL